MSLSLRRCRLSTRYDGFCEVILARFPRPCLRCCAWTSCSTYCPSTPPRADLRAPGPEGAPRGLLTRLATKLDEQCGLANGHTTTSESWRTSDWRNCRWRNCTGCGRAARTENTGWRIRKRGRRTWRPAWLAHISGRLANLPVDILPAAMENRFSRRKIMQGVGCAAVAKSLEVAADAAPAPVARKWPIEEGPDTPKICLSPGDGGQPLPASLQPAPPAAQTGSGRGSAGGPNVFGGFLDPKAEPAPAAPPAAGGPGFGRGGNINASYQRIRQLGVTHLLGVYAGGPGGVVDGRKRAPRRRHRQSGWTGGIQRHDQRSRRA